MDISLQVKEFNERVERLMSEYESFEKLEQERVLSRKKEISEHLETKANELISLQESALEEVEQLENELKQLLELKIKERDKAVSETRAERDALVLVEKTKKFPQELVEGHKLCVCGLEMRPFVYLRSGKEVKIWGCQSGDDTHDWIVVEV